MDFLKLTIEEAARKLRAGEVTSLDLVDAAHRNFKEKNGELNALLEFFDDAFDAARACDAKYGPTKYQGAPVLAGIPIVIKDNILCEGKVATSGSRILDGYVAAYDSSVVVALKKLEAVIVGRGNMDEFAMGSSTESSAWGVTRNPHDSSRVPGGSSGGSVVAVASGMALASLGSDTGGSIRQPAALCGTVGLKSTYGTVSRSGLMALGSSLDQIGPFTKTTADAQIMFDAISGYDPLDSTNVPNPERKLAREASLKKIGVPFSFLEKGIEPDVRANFDASLDRLKKAGYEILDISLPTIPYSLAVYYIIQPAETSANLARFDGVRYGPRITGENLLGDYVDTRGAGFGKEARRRIMLGTYVLSAGYYDAYYGKACAAREKIKEELREVFKTVDAIATPTTTSPAFKFGEKSSDPVAMYLEDIFTVPANIAGVPSMSIPSGTVERDGRQLPVGLQLMAPHFGEKFLFEIGTAFEKTA